jgi:monovalent cation/hydrogen antiporter
VGDLEYLFALVLAAVLLVRVADLARIPYPIVLVVGGGALAFVPGLPDLELDPDVIFLVFLPPLLQSAGWYASPRELAVERRALGVLAVVLVLLTAGAVAVVAHAAVPGLDWATAFVLGAIVAPTDAVSAVATFARVTVSERLSRLVQGEAMINDATALTAFAVAVDVATGGDFGAGRAVLEFVVAAVGGVVLGVAMGWLAIAVVRRLADVSVAVVITVLTAYASYILGEALHVSGVLATVVTGVYAGWRQSEAFDADTRLTATAFWRILTFTLETTLFVLLGLELDVILDELERTSARTLVVAVLLVSLAVIAVRMLSLAPGFAAPGLDRRQRIVVGWCGMRGAISLGAALSVPVGVSGRAEVIVLTYGVILATLIGQGLTLPALVRGLKIPGERPWSPDEAIARLEAAQAALDRLDELEGEGRIDDEQLRRLRELYQARFRMCMAVLGGDQPAALDGARQERIRYSDLRRELIAVERGTLLDLRGDGRLRQDVMREIERDLDLEEARLR